MTKDKHIRLTMKPQVTPTTGAGGQLMSERIAFTPVADAEENRLLKPQQEDTPIAAPQPLFTLPVSDPNLFGAFEGVEEVELDFKVTKRAEKQADPNAPQAAKAKPISPKTKSAKPPNKSGTRTSGKPKSQARRLVSVRR